MVRAEAFVLANGKTRATLLLRLNDVSIADALFLPALVNFDEVFVLLLVLEDVDRFELGRECLALIEELAAAVAVNDQDHALLLGGAAEKLAEVALEQLLGAHRLQHALENLVAQVLLGVEDASE